MGFDEDLSKVLTASQPFGPPGSEAMTSSTDVFRKLYVSRNLPHRRAVENKPSYIIGRRGAGKTTFLIGLSLLDDAQVLPLRSEHIYSEIGRVIKEYSEEVASLTADLSCHIWEVVLGHTAILATVRAVPYAPKYQDLWTYVHSFSKEGEKIELDEYIANVATQIRRSTLDRSADGSFRTKTQAIVRDGVSYRRAMELLTEALEKEQMIVAVVVDNLEDLTSTIYSIEEPLRALLRFVARTKDSEERIVIPYRCQFCFPSELFSKLVGLSAAPEKDLRDRMMIQWHAKELLHLVANRLGYFAAARSRGGAAGLAISITARDLPLHDEDKAIAFLRGFLPKTVRSGLGLDEDPIAYVLRHTQLIPRQLIEIFNLIFRDWAHHDDPEISADLVLAGVREAEGILSSSVMSAYVADFPFLEKAIELLRNMIPLTCEVGVMHKAFKESGGSRSGMDFDSFVEALLTIGALGVWRGSTDRYDQAEFAYTLRDTLPVAGDSARVCIHPLFVRKFHDASSVAALRAAGQKPVYPRGADHTEAEYRQ